LTVETDRVRVRVRRRLPRQGRQQQWTSRSRRRAVQMVFVCAGALLLMVAALYFTLSHEASGAQGSRSGGVVGARVAA
jgi:hypothetical protein